MFVSSSTELFLESLGSFVLKFMSTGPYTVGFVIMMLIVVDYSKQSESLSLHFYFVVFYLIFN